MKINPVSFSSQTRKVNNRQDFETLRDQALDRQLIELLPEFLNGDSDIVFISTSVTPQRDLKMEVRTAKMKSLEQKSIDERSKETFWEKVKKVFKK